MTCEISALYVYPVKACRGIRVARAAVVERGFEADRRWMIVDPNGCFVTQREAPQLTLVRTALDDDGIVLEAPGLEPLRLPRTYDEGEDRPCQIWNHQGSAARHPEGSAWFSSFFGAPRELVYMGERHQRRVNPERARPTDLVSFADGYPFLVISEESLSDLNARLAQPITMERFRPNIVVRGAEPFVEDSFTRVRLGNVTFRGAKRCDRCVVTTLDPDTGEGGREPLRTLASYRLWDSKVWFGMNLIHDALGELSVGDTVERLPAAPIST